MTAIVCLPEGADQAGQATRVHHPCSWPTSPTPLHLGNWEEFLFSHPDHEFASHICVGLTYGFRLGCNRQNTKLVLVSRNHPSALANPSAVSDYIRKDLEDGQLVGPLRDVLHPLLHVSPVGLVPKSHQVDTCVGGA